MLKTSIVGAAALLAGCAGAEPPPQTPPAAHASLPAGRAELLDAFVQRAEAAHAHPAIAFGVVTRDGIAWTATRGTVSGAGGAPVTADTVFRVGSLTKLFTGAAILALRDAHKLDLDDAVEKTIPEMRGVVYPDGAPHTPITIRQLLTHSAGFPRLGRVDYTKGDHEMTEAELLSELAGLKLATAPGTRSHYSNLGFAVLGLVVARASGEPYPAYVAHHLFEPLAMRSSFFRPEDVPAGRLAAGHVARNGAYVAGPPLWRLGAMAGMGGIYSSLDDMGRFTRFALAAWGDAEDAGPLPRATRREWQTAATKAGSGEPAHALPWVVGEMPSVGRIVGHTGSTGDYAASVITAPERGLGAIVLVASGDADDVDRLAWDALAIAATGIAPEHAPRAPEAHEDAKHLATPAEVQATRARVLRLFSEPPTVALLTDVFAPSSKPIEERVKFYANIRAERGACTSVSEGVPTDQQSGMVAFVVTCERGGLLVHAHLAGDRINSINVTLGDKPSLTRAELPAIRAAVMALFSSPPTREHLAGSLATVSDGAVTFFTNVAAQVGACSKADAGRAALHDGLGVGVFVLTCERGAIEVRAHVDASQRKIDWFELRPAER